MPKQERRLFDNVSLAQIHQEIVKSRDKTGTVQMSWRRERDTFFPIAIFLREHLRNLKGALDHLMSDEQKRLMYIKGPPGSGKTTYCLFYFTLFTRTYKKKGLIVQYCAETSNAVMILEENCIRRIATATDDDSMPKLVRELIEEEGKDSFAYCLFDGVRQTKEICGRIGSAITNSVGRKTKVIKVTSLNFDISGGDSTGGIYGIDMYFDSSSWKLGDYENAIKAGLLSIDKLKRVLCLDSDFHQDYEDVKMEDSECESDREDDTKQVSSGWWMSLLERKYFYAGGSARFMFEYSIDELTISTEYRRSVFEKLFGRMTQYEWSLFAELKITPSTPTSVSSGMQRICGKYIPVSKYFLHLAHVQCKAELTSSVRAAAKHTNNPALKGWAFELEQLDIIEKIVQTNPSTLVSEDRALILPINSTETTTYDGNSMGTTQSDVFTIWCSKWNQDCFDVAYYIKSTLVTMKFTVSDSHSLKINPLRNLKDALELSGKEVKKLVHIAVVDEKATCEGFSFNKAEGVGKPVDTIVFSIETACSQKLIATIDPQVRSQPSHGQNLGRVDVYPHKWTPSRKRKKGDSMIQS